MESIFQISKITDEQNLKTVGLENGQIKSFLIANKGHFKLKDGKQDLKAIARFILFLSETKTLDIIAENKDFECWKIDFTNGFFY